MLLPLEGMLSALGELLLGFALVGSVALCGGFAVAVALRLRGWRWTWSALLLLPVLGVTWWYVPLALAGVGVCLVGCTVGVVWHSSDVTAGGDRVQLARARVGVLELVQRTVDGWQEQRQGRGWVHDGYLEVGRDERGRRVSIRVGVGMPASASTPSTPSIPSTSSRGSRPGGEVSGSHTLILGATGSGKTCGEAWVACRLIEQGCAAVAIDPKGDGMLRAELQAAAQRTGAPFLQWTPEGPLAYNPYARGGDSELADKALAGERFTEPHYLRQAQRYLGYALRTMRAAQVPVTPLSLMGHMDPSQLEQTARALPEQQGSAVYDYLDSLDPRQRRELGGVRDRLSILAESDVGPWLDPLRATGTIDLETAVRGGGVVYFDLDADSRPLLGQMLGAAIVSDLGTLAAKLRGQPIPTIVLIDEFAAIGARQIGSLFQRARDAGMSLLLATQELADLKMGGEGALREQVTGNLDCVISYRQNVPESAEWVAAIGGTKPTWVTTQQTERGPLGHTPSGHGSRTRGREYAIHPSRIQCLRTGEAAVIPLGSDQRPTIAQMHHPMRSQTDISAPGGRPGRGQSSRLCSMSPRRRQRRRSSRLRKPK